MDMETLRAVLARIMKGGDTPEKQMGRMQRDALAERDQMDEDRYMGDERAADEALRKGELLETDSGWRAGGNVASFLRSGGGNAMVFYDDSLLLPQLNVTLSRQSWQEVAPRAGAW